MSRIEWILGGLLVLLLAIVGVMALLLWLQPDVSVPPVVSTQVVAAPTPSYEGKTALAASVLAQRVAVEWQADAKLYKADATWHQGASQQAIGSGAAAWTFTYYSPGRQAVAVISVVEEEASLISENSVANPLSPLEVTGWQVDSPQAAQQMLDNGGNQFISREGITTLIMSLTTDNQNGRIEWFVSLFAPQSKNSLTMRLDATGGEVIETIEAP